MDLKNNISVLNFKVTGEYINNVDHGKIEM